MEENYLPLQKKFYEWFRDPVSADPTLKAKENYLPLAKDLQRKFYEWFTDPVSADPPFPAEANHSIGDFLQKLIAAIKIIMRRAETKSLSLGLFIGMSVTVLLLTGMVIPPRVAASLPIETTTATPTAYASTPAPTSTSTIRPPTSTFTATPTLIRPTSTATVTDKATPTFSNTLIWWLQEGYLSQVGPLELGDQIRVYESSLEYVRTSPYKSRRLGEQINGPGYGAPSNICGPLSISILQQAGIVNPDLNPHDFWMLNPDDLGARKLLAKAFSPEKFRSSRINAKLDEIDWKENPLYPGDFLYIYAGSGGNFEHMLVVNRVDADGRAYAVTNYNTENGFIISEVLLYDPNKSDLGMFSTWTVWPNAELGSTGFAGFELWRLREP